MHPDHQIIPIKQKELTPGQRHADFVLLSERQDASNNSSFFFLNQGVATQEAKIFDVDRYTMSKLCDDDNDDNTYIGKGRSERLGQVPYTIFVTKSALEHIELN